MQSLSGKGARYILYILKVQKLPWLTMAALLWFMILNKSIKSFATASKLNWVRFRHPDCPGFPE